MQNFETKVFFSLKLMSSDKGKVVSGRKKIYVL